MNRTENHPAENQSGKHVTLKVQGSCGMCKERIETTAQSIAGVSNALWNDETQQLHFHYDAAKTTLDAIAKAIARAGHDNEKYRADDKVYEALPECCKYRK
jgi:Cu(I)/Ag(I) efflux system membrane fusion protein